MSRRTTVLAAVAGGATVGVVAVVVGRLAGRTVPWPVAVAAGVALGILLALGAWLPHDDPDELEPPSSRPSSPTASLADFGRLHAAVQGAARDPERFEQRIRPRLCAIAVHRLWQHHHLDWRLDAHQLPARSVVGPGTWALLTAPPHSLRPTPRALGSWLDELEDL